VWGRSYQGGWVDLIKLSGWRGVDLIKQGGRPYQASRLPTGTLFSTATPDRHGSFVTSCVPKLVTSSSSEAVFSPFRKAPRSKFALHTRSQRWL